MKKLLPLVSTLLYFLPGLAQINCPPDLPLTLIGNTEYCVGTVGAELSVQENYDGYEWLPTTETSQSVVLTAGSYQLVVTHYTGCTDTLDIEVEQVSNPPQPTVTASGPTEFCEGGSVTLSGPEGYPHYIWNSGSVSQTITVQESLTAVLSVIDWLGCTSSSNSIDVIVNPLPTAIFSPDLEGYDIGFNNLSLDATTFEWNFGDGVTSTDFEPTHSYSLDGEVEMYLVASNDCGSDTAFLNLTSVAVEEVGPIQDLVVYPNPSRGELSIQFRSPSDEKIEVNVFDLTGHLMSSFSRSVRSGENTVKHNFPNLLSGTYILELKTGSGSALQKLQLFKN